MNFKDSFFKSMAVCSFITGSLGLIALFLVFGYGSPADFEEQVAMYSNPLYESREWVVFAMIFFTLLTFWGVTARKLKDSSGLVSTAFLLVLVNSLTGIFLQAVGIFTVNNNWAAKYVEAGEEATKSAIRGYITGYYDIAGAMVFILLITTITPAFLYFLSTWKSKGFERLVCVVFLLNFIANLVWTLAFYSGQGWLVSPMTWVTRILWIILFFVICAWLWRGREAFCAS